MSFVWELRKSSVINYAILRPFNFYDNNHLNAYIFGDVIVPRNLTDVL